MIKRLSQKENLPQSKILRIALGLALIIGGILWFLPVLGIWMIPLGMLVLSVDLPWVRRFRRRMEIKWGNYRKKRKLAQQLDDGGENQDTPPR